MKKKILALVLTALMLLGLTACGPKSIEEVEGTVYECKQFTALCPEDWVNIHGTFNFLDRFGTARRKSQEHKCCQN